MPWKHKNRNTAASIHFPREGEDWLTGLWLLGFCCFNPLPPRGGRHGMFELTNGFRKASIHFPREGEDPILYPFRSTADASIHFPREGEDCFPPFDPRYIAKLQSTSPARGKTMESHDSRALDFASIHFPREGEDLIRAPVLYSISRFNPLPPRGGRRALGGMGWSASNASIHFPREGEDDDDGRLPLGFHASIHFPREGEDRRSTNGYKVQKCFNPLPPRGGRQQKTLLIL